jgi:pilus assembly protein CpaB
MNRKLNIILICAFLIASLAAFAVFRLVGKQMNAKAIHRNSRVAVATRDLPIGTLIKASDLSVGEVAGAAPKDAILTPEAAVGRGVISTLYAGEPVMERRLAAVGSGAGLAATIPSGMRACAVRVDEVVGLSGFVVPGMRVDVIISGNDSSESQGNMKVKTLLQNIEVLSAGTNIQKDDEGKPIKVQVVNLLVNPEQAELLSLASNETKIQLVLRNPLDTDLARPPGAMMAGLFNGPAAPKKTGGVKVAAAPKKDDKAAPPVWVIKVLNGSKETKETFLDSTN